MQISSYSSREFTRDVAAAKRATQVGTVFITDRGQPAYALLDIKNYYHLVNQKPQSLLDMMRRIECAASLAFEPEKMQLELKNVDFE